MLNKKRKKKEEKKKKKNMTHHEIKRDTFYFLFAVKSPFLEFLLEVKCIKPLFIMGDPVCHIRNRSGKLDISFISI